MTRGLLRTPGLLRAMVAASVIAVAVTGCSSGDGTSGAAVAPSGSSPSGSSAATTPPSPTGVPSDVSVTEVPGAKAVEPSGDFKKKVTYPDKVSVSVTEIRRVTNEEEGPGNVKGQVLTIFTVRFDNDSAKALDLNTTRVTAIYGKDQQAKPTYYADLNDFFGEVAPRGDKTAAYAFAIPLGQYGKVRLKVDFGSDHKTAEWTGSLKK